MQIMPVILQKINLNSMPRINTKVAFGDAMSREERDRCNRFDSQRDADWQSYYSGRISYDELQKRLGNVRSSESLDYYLDRQAERERQARRDEGIL